MRRAVLLGTLTGCFGAGPDPTQPAQATVLFALELGPLQEDNCHPHPFIGTAALGESSGYIVTEAYLPSCSNGTGNASEPMPAAVLQFSLGGSGGQGQSLGMAGSVNEGGSQKPGIGAFGSEAVWMFRPQEGSGAFEVHSRDSTIGGTFSSTVSAVAGVVMEATRSFVAVWQPPGGSYHPNHPRFPCCGSGGGPPGGTGDLLQMSNTPAIATTGFGLQPQLYCEQMRTCVVGNTSTLYYLQHDSPIASLRSQPKDATAGEQVATLGEAPTGLAADDSTLVWSMSLDFTRFGESAPPSQRCAIHATTVAAPHTERTLLDTDRFSCMDLALDGTFVYFTIVELVHPHHDSSVVNRGLGRIAIDTGALETLALGIDGPEAGPRQVMVAGNDLVVVAPFVVARLPKSALDGSSDIEP